METSDCLSCGKVIHYNSKRQLGKYCNNKCQAEYQRQVKLDLWLNEGIVPGVKIIRRHLTNQCSSCYSCGISSWQNSPITLEIDHIDGNYENNTPENLRLLCPNCHSQTPTFRNKNRGNGRSYRRKSRP